MLHEWLHAIGTVTSAVANLMALLLISSASFYVFGRAVLLVLKGKTTPDGRAFRGLWLTYARWLVVGLIFQFAAWMADSSVYPSWEAIAMLGAVAAAARSTGAWTPGFAQGVGLGRPRCLRWRAARVGFREG